MKPIIIDTSCIVALIDRSEKAHDRCRGIVLATTDPLLTCEAVIAESCYLLRKFPSAVDAVLDNVQRGILQVSFDIAVACARVRQLLLKYKSLSMDFADACLVCMAEEYDTGSILTLDKDFNVYRWGRNRPFRNLLDGK